MHVSTTILKDLPAQLSKVFDQYERVGTFVLIDEKVRSLYSDSLALKQARSILSIAGGEGVKQLDSLERISTWLVQEKAERGALLVVIGGGSLLDLGGFVASIFKRGLRLVFVPTTLLSMVDAAIGGKNGVNMAGAKNMLGTFYQPEAIITDEKFLLSLSAAEIKSGLSEMLKHAFISGGQHWDDFCKQAPRDLIPSAYLIEHSARVKAKISSQDERELSLRKVLNFGHTVGHALESYCLENGISTTHGECVAAGMEVEIRVAEAMGITPPHLMLEFLEVLFSLALRPSFSWPEFDSLKVYLANDKKIHKDHFLIPCFSSLGVFIIQDVGDDESFRACYETSRQAIF